MTHKLSFSGRLLALAAATCVLTTPALAQSDAVTLYGTLDMGFVRESGGATGAVSKLTSGVATGSRWGLRGREDLGGGYATFFNLESGINADNGTLGQGGRLFGRVAVVGLSTPAGTLSLGRMYTSTALIQATMDPFSTGLAGTSANLMSPGGAGGNNRMDNAVRYELPKMGAFSAEVAYALGETPGDSSLGREMGGSVSYADGPLTVKLGLHRQTDGTGVTSRVTWLAGRYDFGGVALHATYVDNKNSRVFGLLNPDSSDWLLGLTAPVGAGRLMLSYIHKNDRTATNHDARQWAVGYSYPMSKRTSVYASYAHISNRSPFNTVGAPGFYRVGNATEQGSGNKGFTIGVRHDF